MLARLSLLSPLAAAALCAAAGSPAAAQRVATDHVRPIVQHAAVTLDAAPLRTVAVYQFGASHETGLPAQVTVADSAGKLVATYRLPGGRGTGPMTVDALNTDLMLQGETPSGLLTLMLYRQNNSDTSGTFVGRWSLGEREGELRGRTTR